MARPATGVEHIAAARDALLRAKTADEMRAAQAVLLPLEMGLSLEQTGRAIGRIREGVPNFVFLDFARRG